MRRKTFLISLALAFVCLACDKDDVKSPDGQGGDNGTVPGTEDVADAAVVLRAGISGMSVSQVKGRATVDGNWEGLDGALVAIKIGDEVKNYVVDADGMLTCDEPFYWGENEKLTIEGWYPCNNGVKQTEIIVKSDQSVAENFLASDYLEALPAEVEKAYPRLSFAHRVSKLVFTVYVENGTSQGAALKLLNMQGVEGSDEITPTAASEALVVPQTVGTGAEFLSIDLPSGLSVRYEAESDFIFEQGYMYIINVRISQVGGVTAEISDKVQWTGTDETLDGEASEVKPGTDSGWTQNGEDEELSGGSSEADSQINAPGWTGDEATELPATQDQTQPEA